MGPKEPKSTVLTTEEEALIVAFRMHTMLPLDDCLYALQENIPHLTHSSLHRCLQHQGIMTATFFGHPFMRVCKQNGIEHRLTKPNHPWTNGQVEWMNRTLKYATVNRYYYQNHRQLQEHLNAFHCAYNFVRRHKTLHGLTPYQFVLKRWGDSPDLFQSRLSLGLNT